MSASSLHNAPGARAQGCSTTVWEHLLLVKDRAAWRHPTLHHVRSGTARPCSPADSLAWRARLGWDGQSQPLARSPVAGQPSWARLCLEVALAWSGSHVSLACPLESRGPGVAWREAPTSATGHTNHFPYSSQTRQRGKAHARQRLGPWQLAPRRWQARRGEQGVGKAA